MSKSDSCNRSRRSEVEVSYGGIGKRLAELYFVHRPEGRNTLYQADTQRYEEVRQVTTSAGIHAMRRHGSHTSAGEEMNQANDGWAFTNSIV